MIDKESKWKVECEFVGFTWLGKVDANRSRCSCNVCGHVDVFEQSAMRRGDVKCTQCHESKMREECLAAGFTWIENIDGRYSKCSCNVCGHVDEYVQGHIRAGKLKCTNCHETKMRMECESAGFTWIEKVDGNRSKCSCNVCGYVDEYVKSNIRKGNVRCSKCQFIKYQQAVKDGWSFVNHFRNGRRTYVNLKHSCGDALVKVQSSHYLKGEYSCPICMHSHFNDPSYFYVIQVGSIIKLGISNRPTQRYTKYGLPEDATIVEHLRIPLENKRDALVVESHAKQLVKDYKIPTDVAKQMFTKSGYNECYSLESLDLLMTI